MFVSDYYHYYYSPWSNRDKSIVRELYYVYMLHYRSFGKLCGNVSFEIYREDLLCALIYTNLEIISYRWKLHRMHICSEIISCIFNIQGYICI